MTFYITKMKDNIIIICIDIIIIIITITIMEFVYY